MRLLYLCAILFCTLSSQTSFGQHYQRGYILENGKKREGLINYSPTKKRHDVLYFKADGFETVQEFTAELIEGFYLDFYDAQFIVIDEEDTGKKIFTELIISGPVTLSSFQNLYVLSKEGKTLQLNLPIGKNVYENRGEVMDKRLIEIKTTGMIKEFLGDCRESETSDLSSLSISRLSKAIINFNQCKGVVSSPKKGGVRPGIVLGSTTTMLKLSDNPRTFQPQTSLAFGASVDIVPNNFLDKTVLNLQAIYYNVTSKEDSDNGLELSYRTLRFPLSLKKYFQPGQRGFFINPGVSPLISWDFEAKNNLIFRPFKLMQAFSGTAFLGLGWESFLFSKQKVTFSMRFESDVVSTYNYESIYRYVNFQVVYGF